MPAMLQTNKFNVINFESAKKKQHNCLVTNCYIFLSDLRPMCCSSLFFFAYFSFVVVSQ